MTIVAGLELISASYRLPGGTLTVVVDPHALGDCGPTEYGAVVAGTFRGLDDARARLVANDRVIHPRTHVPAVRSAIERYVDGELDSLTAVSVLQWGGPFQQRVWAAMRTITAGCVMTYAELARLAGNPRAVRAAGTACASNMVAPFVPCHRVVARGGLGGYGYGLDVKVALLEHEGVLL